MRSGVALIVVALMLSGTAFAGDWPQWRGPEGNGIAPDSPPLVDGFDPKGPPLVWTSEPIPGGRAGGYGSVSIAGGRAFVFACRLADVPVEPRKLTTDGLGRLGWAAKFPEDLATLVEAARLSPEREALKSDALRAWIDAWVKANEKPEWRRFRFALTQRLQAGREAIAPGLARKLEAVVDREFAGQAALDAWFEQNGFDEAARKTVMAAVPTIERRAADTLYALDAGTGKTLWRADWPGVWMAESHSPTPCVNAGRCYITGSDAVLRAFDADTGHELWKTPPLTGPDGKPPVGGHNRSSSPVVVDGVVIAGTEHWVFAVDAVTGKALWHQKDIKQKEATPAIWRTKDQAFLVCNQGSSRRDGECRLNVVNVKTGEVVCSAPGGGASTPAVVGDVAASASDVVFLGGVKAGRDAKASTGLAGYRLSASKAERIWNILDFEDGYASPVIVGDYVYALGDGDQKPNGQMLCVELATGRICWREKLDRAAQFTSPVVADGKIIATVGPWLYLIAATPGKYTLLGKANLRLEKWMSPAFADGLVYVRTAANIVCYDLRRSSAPGTSGAGPRESPPIPPIGGVR